MTVIEYRRLLLRPLTSKCKQQWHGEHSVQPSRCVHHHRSISTIRCRTMLTQSAGCRFSHTMCLNQHPLVSQTQSTESNLLTPWQHDDDDLPIPCPRPTPPSPTATADPCMCPAHNNIRRLPYGKPVLSSAHVKPSTAAGRQPGRHGVYTTTFYIHHVLSVKKLLSHMTQQRTCPWQLLLSPHDSQLPGGLYAERSMHCSNLTGRPERTHCSTCAGG
jgi:hypothetical protein